MLREVFINECKKHSYEIDIKNIMTMDSVCISMSQVENNLKDHYGEEEEEEKEEVNEKITIDMYVKNNIYDFAKLFE